MVISVTSFNLRFGRALDGRNRWRRRRGIVFETVRTISPDILGVQEALDFQLAELLEELPRYSSIGKGREAERGGEHAAVLVDRERFVVERTGDFWLSATPDIPGSVGWDASLPRICTWVVLRDADHRFAIANTHFDHRGAEARLRSVDVVLEHVEALEMPAVVMGDLNAGEDSPVVARFLFAGYRDTYRELHPDAPGGTWHGFGAVEARSKIDYILCGERWRVLDAAIVREAIGGRYPSDHYPVTARLELRE